MQDPLHLQYLSLLLPVTVAAPLCKILIKGQNIRINMVLTGYHADYC